MSERLTSEKVVLSSPMSFTGSRARMWKLTDTDNVWLRWIFINTFGNNVNPPNVVRSNRLVLRIWPLARALAFI